MRVLLIENNPGDARLVQEILKGARGTFTISVAEKLGLGMKLLLSQDVDVVLLALNLPDSHGLIALTELQTRFSRMPIVIMTSHDDEELAHKAVQLGAQDYLAKGNVNGELLRRTLEYAIERKKSEVALRTAHDELELRVEERTQELKKAERGLKELNETLEERVAERTAELLGVNIFLRNSRRATLNIMEDALASRKGAEEANVELWQEVAERKRGEAALLRLNKALKALSDSSQAVIRAKDEPEYLNDVCRIIVEDCGYSMTWIGFTENDDAKSVRPAAYSGFEEGYLETLKLTWADTERGRGPTGTAIRTGNVAVCRNMLTDPAFMPWREEAIKRGYASSIVFPLRSDGRVFGAISMYSKEADPFTEDEIRLLTELTDNVAYGIEVLRIRAAQKRAEESLRESEGRVRRKLDSILSPEGELGDLELADIIDSPAIQSLMDDFYKIAHVPIGIIDLKGRVLVGVGWQDICTKFHRAHPDTCRHCVDSDLELTRGTPAGEFKLYKCKNNMWDAGLPVMVGDQHIGNLFWGQFFFEDEPLDRDFFRAQARTYGFNEEEYLAALERVPRISRAALEHGMSFYQKLADMLSKLSYGNIKLARSLAQRDSLTASLRESEARFRTLFETMTEGFSLCEIILDDARKPVDFRYLSVNPSFERHTGLKAADIVGRTVRELFPKSEPVWAERYGKAALTGEPEHFVERFGPLDKWFEVSAYRTEPGRFAVVFFDITERKKTEQDILKLSEDMAARNLELESVNKELESFIYSVSHDLRAPIRTMSGFAKIVNEDYAGKLDAQGQDYLNRILRGSERSTQLIDDLLHLSRISRQELDRIEIDLSRKASKVAEELRETDPGRNVEVIVQEGMTASVDPRLIEIALSNLLENAWKFTSKTKNAKIEFGMMERNFAPHPTSPRQGEEISQSAIRKEPALESSNRGQSEIVYFIRDNGAGFNMQYADKMFWPFHRLHADKEFEGTGIGLTIVERIIHRHGGKVWAEGEVGKGATVFFTLG
jgi:PAS domain S-box-containing protein